MKRLKRILALALVVATTAIYALVPVIPAAADSSSLSITPKKNYVIDPGKSVDDTFTIRNLDSDSELDLNLRVIDFTYTDDSGTPKLMLATDAPQTTWSLKPFLTIPETVAIPAGQSKTLNMSVSIPANQGAGSYYSAILYSTGAPNGGNIGLSASGVTLVFVSVPGQVNENLTLKNLGAYHAATDTHPAGYDFITSDEPQDIGYTLQNSGNVTESPAGTITLKDIFGRVTTINNVNPAGSLALIGQTRTFTACIKLKDQDVNLQGTQTETSGCTSPGLWPGPYTVSLDVFYGQNGNQTQEIIGSAVFWYLPWWFVITFLVLLAIIVLVVWRLVHKIRARLNGMSRGRSSFRRR